jgi:hypothetical protein
MFGFGLPAASPAQDVRAGLKAPAGTWSQSAELLGSDTVFSNYPHETSDFGWSVAVWGSTAVVGAPWFSSTAGFKGEGNESPLGLATGRAYVFTRNAAGWHQAAELVGSDTTQGNEFGASVAISGNTIVVGAPGHGPKTTFSSGNQYVGAGRAYVFQKSATGWHQTARLATTSTSYASGCSVGVSGTTAMVGAFSGVYVFHENATGWHQATVLEPDPSDLYCYSVAVYGNTAAVGNWWENRVTTFSNSATGWHQAAQLNVLRKCVYVSQGNCLGRYSGASVAMSGNVLVVGAPGQVSEETYPNGQVKVRAGAPGQTYIFTRDATGWHQTASLAGSAYYFGWSVAISGSAVVIGVPGTPGTPGTGRAYVFTSGAAGWRLAAKLMGSGTVTGDFLGNSVAISGGTVVVGAPCASQAFAFTR